MDELTPAQQAVLQEIDGPPRHIIYIPERKSPDMTPEIWEKRGILKELVYKGLVRMDVDFNARCLVFCTAQPGCLGDILYPQDAILEAEYLG